MTMTGKTTKTIHYTVKEVAALLRVHPSTIDRERRDGRLACLRIGRRVFVTPGQLDDYIEARKEEACRQRETSRLRGSLNIPGTGWSGDPTRPTTTSTGADPALAASAARARIQEILNRPSGG
ncbi:MAG: helix-turn-helix domain-containing protein [Phycisphaeraceae bacterium]|nr:helix-turn-helix domain-containing protein [Phycisphaerales bacterium]MCB9842475.1 helix-turn-helix domain-containing protein [Phycisphaeraceae bacterium]